uniref:SMP-30/Gluconolactonase/LRE-like region domain-containing protein n=1 Tax=Arcella intermedia TaxID=1963864 RepID=A0A6B2L869_9EUKA
MISVAEDTMGWWENAEPEDGGLFGIDPKTDAIKPLPLTNFPKGVPFHPHGLSIDPSRSFLYVINHAFDKGGERVEVFKVTGDSLDNLLLRHYQSIVLDDFLQGVSNDLVFVREGFLLVTQWRAFREVERSKGRQAKSYLSTLVELGNLLDVLHSGNWSHIWGCSFDHKKQGTVRASCLKTSPGVNQPNGIIIGDDNLIYVAQPVQKVITVYEFENDKLVPRKSIETPFSIDNLVKLENGVLMGGGTFLHAFVEFSTELEKRSARPRDKFVPGSVIEIRKEEGGEYEISTTHVIPGELHSGISVAFKHNKKVFLGSWFDEGILVCPAQGNAN